MDASVVARILLFATTVQFSVLTAVVTAGASGVPTYDLCSLTSPLRLDGSGIKSAASLALSSRGSSEPQEESSDEDSTRRPEGPGGRSCRLEVAAPDTHLLSLLFVSSPPRAAPVQVRGDSDNDEFDSNDVDRSQDNDVGDSSCVLSVMLGCDSAVVWSANLCDVQSKQAALLFTELFPRNVTLLWTPPAPGRRSAQQASRVILTAVGRGAQICSSDEFHNCWRRPRLDTLCVASELRCDGHRNCPTDGNDESAEICKPDVVGFDDRRNLNGASLLELIKQAVSSTQVHNNTRHRQEIHHHEPVPGSLSNYGPWGYLLLGALVCGAVLMLCGLWECCCRQPKTNSTSPNHSQPVLPVLILNQPQSVLSQDSDGEDDPPRPPAYDDLDQPPSYGALFPVQPKDDSPDAPIAYMDAEGSESADEGSRLDPNSRTSSGVTP